MIPEPRLVGVKSTLERTKRAVLVCHRKPDGDALGATLGLSLALQARGVAVQGVCVDEVPSQFRFLPGADTFRQNVDLDGVDLLVMLDCGADEMSGLPMADLSKQAPLVDIDHHPKQGFPPSPRLAVYDQQASSAAEIVYELLHFGDWPITRDVATCLLTGIVFDTSAFQNSNTTPRTLQVAAQLLRSGARLKEIIKQSFYSSSIPKLRLWGTAMARIEQNAKAAGVVSTVLTHEDIAECGATKDDVEGLANFLNAIPGVPALMVLTETKFGEIKGSLRTRNDQIDVSVLAALLGGGGHRQASGFSLPGHLVRAADDSWRVLPPSPGQV